VGLAILFVDFLSKSYVYHVLGDRLACMPNCPNSIPVFTNFLGVDFAISLTLNRGAAWGLFSQFQVLLLFVRIIVVVGLLIYIIFINTNRRVLFPFVLIVSGAIGNIADYFLYGYVVDFLKFNLWGYHFPVFNFADCAITVGVFWLFFVAIFDKKKIKK